MTQKFAIVPVKNAAGPICRISAFSKRGPIVSYTPEDCKITRAQIEVMAKAAAMEEHGYEVVAGPTRIKGIIAAVKAIGLEVEEGE
ncbi:hypothetical protein [Thalassospira marina]|uniref:Uncharacterized protein n=1 Tax=Thalassospira marina TaxID=2048283 RepID=A0A2N3KXZ2_9PROT|nr:hypothetical protein [Thalassospira marina]PKR55444.1 hypothetical protein COO20_04545 [Thalassospira marina]